MAMLQMQRITIYALKKYRKPVLELIQRRGVIEISDTLPEDHIFKKTDMTNVKSSFDKNINAAKEAVEIIEKYAPAKKPLLSMLYGRDEVSVQTYDAFKEKYEPTIRIANRIVAYQKEIIEYKAEIQKLSVQAEILTPWISLDIPLNFNGTKNTRCFIGSVPNLISLEDIYQKLADYLPVDVEIISASKEQTCIFVLCTKEKADGVYESLRQMDFSHPGISSEKAPSQQLEDIKKQIADAKDATEKLEKCIIDYSYAREDLLFLQDYDRMRYDKYDVIGHIVQSKNVFVLSGYIPEKYAKKLEEDLSNRFEAVIEVEPPQDNEDVPVVLKNNGFAEPLEWVVEGFSLPGIGEVDPTMAMALFYYFLFGLMLADAGYGLLIIAACSYCLIKGKHKMEQFTKNFMKMFLFCGISTTFWGIMFGSFFGDIVDVIASKFFGVTKLPVIPALWFVPVNKPMQMLSFSMILGLIHILTGLVIKVYQLMKQKDYLGIIYDALSWFALVVSSTFLLMSLDMIKNILGYSFSLPESIVKISAALAVLSSVVIVLTNGRESKNPIKRFLKGAYALYGITGYLSDVLSYSRLLALGLASGVIANVINKMAGMAGNGVVGPVIMLLILVLGHSINFAINILGAYVHTNRLQYVEFFGKFYNGGGRSFQPFHMKTKYFKVKESK
jgi:V/A-type H+-transporting ATPase subunit I